MKEVEPSNCPICQHPDSEYLTEEIAEGKLLKGVAAEELQCDVDTINYHMDHHLNPDGLKETTRSADGKSDLLVSFQERDSYDKLDILETNVKRLTEKFDGILQRDNWEPQDATQIVKVHQELRRTIDTLDDLMKDERKKRMMTQQQFEDFKAAVLRELDEENQKKVLNALEDKIEIEAEK